MTKYRTTNVFGFFLTISLLLSTSYSQTGRQTIHVLNDFYSYKLVERDSVSLFVVEGFSPSSPEEASIPTRKIRENISVIKNPRVTISNVKYGPSFSASPFYYYQHRIYKDSTIETSLYSAVGRFNSLDSIPAVRSTGYRQEGDFVSMEIEIPLLVYNPQTNLVRWIQSCNLSIETEKNNLLSSSGILGEGRFYSGMPFVRNSYDFDTSGSWISYNQHGIVFYVNSDGLYKISKSWLEASGANTNGIDPSKMKLFRKGQEIALFPVGMDDGRIDDPDYFVFYGERNYCETGYRYIPVSIDDAYPQYLNKYSDSTAYWIFWEGAQGIRMKEAQYSGPIPTDSLDWSFLLYRMEDDNFLYCTSTDVVRQQIADWTSEDTWFQGWIQPGGIPDYSFEAGHVKPGIRGKIRHKCGSWASNPLMKPNHTITVGINGGSILDSAVFDLGKHGLINTRTGPFDIKDGKNRVDIRSVKLYEGDNFVYLDWTEVEYPRYLFATDNNISFTVDQEMGTGPKQIVIKNFSSNDIFIERIRGMESVRISNYSISPAAPYLISFIDTLNAGTKYVISGIAEMKELNRGSIKKVENLRTLDRQAQHVIITAREFLPEAESYAQLIINSYAVESRTICVEDIYDNYSYGVFNPEAIKLFLFDAHTKWKASPIKYVFLVGDANYNYKVRSAPFIRNFVPSYGFPVSDIWYVSFDPDASSPSLSIGRLPIRNASQLVAYKEKHEKYIKSKPDVWNKTTLHFSGGFASLGQAQLDELRKINDRVIDEIVKPAPFGGFATHFYKTITPQTDFGPYTHSFVRRKIEEGGIIISYVGHSAIQTWDNSIGDAAQLNNNRDKSSLVSDFGCSTGKFADPNMDSFAEMFVVPEESQAIGYIGNASIGFTSTAGIMPITFYKALLKDGFASLGDAHRKSKTDIAQLYGLSTINKIAIQSNALIADPIIIVPVPDKPNFIAKTEWIKPTTEIFTNYMDSVGFEIAFGNYGKVISDSIDILIQDIWDGNVKTSLLQKRITPFLYDTLVVSLPTFGVAGIRTLRVSVDPGDLISEMEETDNIAEYTYSVLSAHMQVVNATLGKTAAGWRNIGVLNPMLNPGEAKEIYIEIDTDPLFQSPSQLKVPYGKTVTRLPKLPNLGEQYRHFWRARLDITGSEFIGPFSFWQQEVSAPYIIRDSSEFALLERKNIELTLSGCSIAPLARSLRVVSSGFSDGNFGTVELDGINILPATFGRGYMVAIIDSGTVGVDTVGIFDNYESIENAKELSSFISSIPFGKIIAIATIDEPHANSREFSDAMKNIGSVLIDSVRIDSIGFRSSWAIIGKRGATQGSVPEAFSRQYQGKVSIDTVYNIPPDTGYVHSRWIGPAKSWKKVFLERSSSASTNIDLEIYGRTANGESHHLHSITNPDSVDISGIDTEQYQNVKLIAKLIPTEHQNDTRLLGWSVDYIQLPELAVNYQSISLSSDSVLQGESVFLHVGILNAGESDAGTFTIYVETIGEDNIRKPIKDFVVAGLISDSWFDTTLTVQTYSLINSQKIIVSIDKENAISEQHKSNNVYISKLFVKRDSVRPELTVLFDGGFPIDGDYIRPNPIIVMSLSDKSPLLVTKPENFLIWLDDTLVSTKDLPFVPMSSTSKAELTYTPLLMKGAHTFRFNAKDASDNLAYTTDIMVHIQVDTENTLKELYAYPNPFADVTSLTFILTGTIPPDEMEFKFYTVGGKMIRSIKYYKENLRIGFNAFPWDGRDADGGEVANGVYFYKVLSKYHDQSTEIIGKISKLR